MRRTGVDGTRDHGVFCTTSVADGAGKMNGLRYKLRCWWVKMRVRLDWVTL